MHATVGQIIRSISLLSDVGGQAHESSVSPVTFIIQASHSHTFHLLISLCAINKNHTTIILVVGQADTSCKASSHFCYTRDKCRKLWGNERKWEEKEEMERKWREMEEMEREEISLCLSLHFTSLSPFLRSLHILLLFPFPHSVPISMLPGCRRLWQPVVGVVWTKTHNKLVTH